MLRGRLWYRTVVYVCVGEMGRIRGRDEGDVAKETIGILIRRGWRGEERKE